MGCQRRLDLSELDDLRRGTALHCLKPAQVWQRHNRCRLAAQMDYLVWLAWLREAGLLR